MSAILIDFQDVGLSQMEGLVRFVESIGTWMDNRQCTLFLWHKLSHLIITSDQTFSEHVCDIDFDTKSSIWWKFCFIREEYLCWVSPEPGITKLTRSAWIWMHYSLTGARQTPSRIASRPAVNSRSPAGSNAQVEELSSQVQIFSDKTNFYCYYDMDLKENEMSFEFLA